MYTFRHTQEQQQLEAGREAWSGLALGAREGTRSAPSPTLVTGLWDCESTFLLFSATQLGMLCYSSPRE